MTHSQNDRQSTRFSGKCYLYGAGNLGLQILRLMRKLGTEVLAFIDQNPQKTSVDGIPVLLPNDIRLKKETTVLIAVFNSGKGAENWEISDTLNKLGFRNIVTFLEINAVFHKELQTCMYVSEPSFYDDKMDSIAKARSLWNDPASLDLFDAELQARMTGKYRKYKVD